MNIRDFSHEELTILEKIRKQDIESLRGFLYMFSWMFAISLIGLTAIMAEKYQVSFYGYGGELALLVMLGSLFISFRQLFRQVKYQDEFLAALAKRMGFKMIEKYTMVMEGDYPQIHDEVNNVYYRIIATKDGVSIREIKKL